MSTAFGVYFLHDVSANPETPLSLLHHFFLDYEAHAGLYLIVLLIAVIFAFDGIPADIGPSGFDNI